MHVLDNNFSLWTLYHSDNRYFFYATRIFREWKLKIKNVYITDYQVNGNFAITVAFAASSYRHGHNFLMLFSLRKLALIQ